MAEHHVHKVVKADSAEGRLNYVFFEFWPIMWFVCYFLAMISLPLTLSGLMHNPFSSSDSVWAGYGLLIILEFVLGLAVFILAPRLVMPYFLLVIIYGLILAEWHPISQNYAPGHHIHSAWQAGWINDGFGHTWMISVPAILFLTYFFVAWFVMMQGDRNDRRLK